MNAMQSPDDSLFALPVSGVPFLESDLCSGERDCLVPALELFFNGAATAPAADALLAYDLATVAQTELFVASFVMQVATVEPTHVLQDFVVNAIKRHKTTSWFPQVLGQILAYAVRDEGQGACTTRRMAEYAINADDSELLSVLVDFHTRKPFFRVRDAGEKTSHESARLVAANREPAQGMISHEQSWSWFRPRASTIVISHRQADRPSQISIAHERIRKLGLFRPMMQLGFLDPKLTAFVGQLAMHPLGEAHLAGEGARSDREIAPGVRKNKKPRK
ncbi:hypothetical protein QCN27_13945 [Cereibacter sp. SYSU M97828]|nr:hypothetical protein [Cereibacter flavus]